VRLGALDHALLQLLDAVLEVVHQREVGVDEGVQDLVEHVVDGGRLGRDLRRGDAFLDHVQLGDRVRAARDEEVRAQEQADREPGHLLGLSVPARRPRDDEGEVRVVLDLGALAVVAHVLHGQRVQVEHRPKAVELGLRQPLEPDPDVRRAPGQVARGLGGQVA
jgi:hypothetical protein